MSNTSECHNKTKFGKSIFAFSFFLIFLFLLPPVVTSEDVIVTETQITDDAYSQLNPKIFENVIVWEDMRNNLDIDASYLNQNRDIYAYNIINETVFQITTNKSLQAYPEIYGNLITWGDHRVNSDGLALYNLDNGTVYFTSAIDNLSTATGFYCDKLVWSSYYHGNYSIILYNLSNDQETIISTNNATQTNPDIWGNYVVWEGDNGVYRDIYLYDLFNNKTTRITNSNVTGHSYHNPRINYDKVLYVESIPMGNIYGHPAFKLITWVYNISTGKYCIIPDDSSGGVLYSHNYVWYNRSLNEMFLYDLFNNETIELYHGGSFPSDMYENKIVYAKDGDIYLLEFNFTSESTNAFENYTPYIILSTIIILLFVVIYLQKRRNSPKR